MKISFWILCCSSKLLIKLWDKYCCEKSVSLINTIDSCKTKGFDESILKSAIHSFYSSFCLRRIGKDKSNPEFLTNSSELSHYIARISCSRVVDLVGSKFIQIQRVRLSEACIFYVFFPEWKDILYAFIHSKLSFEYFSCGIIRCKKETTGTRLSIDIHSISSFQPSMIRSIELYHFSESCFWFSPFTMFFSYNLFGFLFFPQSPEYHLGSKSLRSEGDGMKKRGMIFHKLFQSKEWSASKISVIREEYGMNSFIEFFFFGWGMRI